MKSGENDRLIDAVQCLARLAGDRPLAEVNFAARNPPSIRPAFESIRSLSYQIPERKE